jgi:hypothetical protein
MSVKIMDVTEINVNVINEDINGNEDIQPVIKWVRIQSY